MNISGNESQDLILKKRNEHEEFFSEQSRNSEEKIEM
jgi:hypothetical protein